jgi:hypothetical protein
MAWSAVLRFADPLPAQAAIQGSDIEAFPTAKGRLDAEITKIRFDRLWMQRFHTSLPQVVGRPAHDAPDVLTMPEVARAGRAVDSSCGAMPRGEHNGYDHNR